jgi:amicoumacin kinase
MENMVIILLRKGVIMYQELSTIAATLYNGNHLVKLTGGFQNNVFQYRFGNELRILRVTNSNHRDLESIKGELEFIQCLSNAGVPVSCPLISAKGHLIEEFQQDNQTYFLTAFTKAKGTPIEVTNLDVWNKELFRNWGRTLGKMHTFSSKNYEKFQTLKRPAWSGLDERGKTFISSKSIEAYKAYQNLLDQINAFPTVNGTFGLIHNDFHQGNLFVNEGQIHIFDFDDCSFNWFAQDIAVSFYHAIWQGMSFNPGNDNFPFEFISYFLDGYSQEKNLHKEIVKQIPLFLKFREFFLYILFNEKWDFHHLEDWQAYTIKDLFYRIENDIPYTNVNFDML